MTLRLQHLFGAALGLVTTFGAFGVGTAEAGRHTHFGGGGGGHVSVGGGFSVGGGGGVHVSSWGAGGGVAAHWSRPTRHWNGNASTWGVRGHIYVGGGGGYYQPYRPYYYYYGPEYVPSYYGTSYYPIDGTGAPAAAVSTPQPDLPRLGIGLFAGGQNVATRGGDSFGNGSITGSNNGSTDVGVLGRIRLTPGLIIEGELGKTNFKNDLRVDRRLGGSLIYEFGAYNTFAPYVLAGIGAQQADVGGTYTTTQDFAEIGVGLRFALSRNLAITADIRAGSRNTVSSDQPTAGVGGVARTVAPPDGKGNSDPENYTRGRLAAILYF